jgi:solute carrier family 25 (mitochondrial citrate transporter), member 1
MGEKSEKRKVNVVKDLVAGGAAGCLEVTIMYPTEYIKTQLQLQPKGAKLYNGMADCAVSQRRHRFRDVPKPLPPFCCHVHANCPVWVTKVRNSIPSQIKTVKERGVLGLYRGLTSLLIGTAPKASIRFATFSYVSKLMQVRCCFETGQCQPWLMRVSPTMATWRFYVLVNVEFFCAQDDKGKTSAFGNWVAGAMAGLVEATLVVTPVETMKTKLIHDMVRWRRSLLVSMSKWCCTLGYRTNPIQDSKV